MQQPIYGLPPGSVPVPGQQGMPLPPGMMFYPPPHMTFPSGMMPPPGAMPMMPGMPGMMPMMPGMMPPRMPPGMMPPPPGMMLPPPPGMFPPPPTAAGAGGQVMLRPPTMTVGVPAPTMMTPSASNGYIHAFNLNNSACPFFNHTCELLNRHIFLNALAGMPLTIFVGNVPLDWEDLKLVKIFETCGKMSRFLRPVDPKSQIPANFLLVTYAQAICALRAVTLLNGLEIEEDGRPKQLLIKVGTKETTVINAVRQAETEAIEQLPEGASIEDLYRPIRQVVSNLLSPPPPAPELTILAADEVEAGEEPSAEQLPEKLGPDGKPINYYNLITRPKAPNEIGREDDEETEEGEVNEVGEKYLYSEIGKFRVRQMQRDKELEDQRRNKIKAKIHELERAKKRAEEELKNSDKDGKAAEDVSSNSINKRKLDELHDAEAEEKKLLRLKVLQSMAGMETTVEIPEAKSGPLFVGLNKKGVSTAGTGGSAAASSAFGGANIEDEEEMQRSRREMILLNYTEEELREMEEMAKRHAEDEDDEEIVEGEDGIPRKRKKTHALPAGIPEELVKAIGASGNYAPGSLEATIASINQKLMKSGAVPPTSNTAATSTTAAPAIPQEVLARAQALSAAVAAKSAASSTAEASSAEKDGTQQLVDKIPSNKDEILKYRIAWNVIDRHNVVKEFLEPWIVKKIVEYLGEEEESLTSFVVSKLQAHCVPAELLEELSMVLDADSEPFVVKLWRMLIYYNLKFEHATPK